MNFIKIEFSRISKVLDEFSVKKWVFKNIMNDIPVYYIHRDI